MALCLAAFLTLEGQAGAWLPGGFEQAAPSPIATPVKVYKDCQEIALCAGCQPRYKCRSCQYQRVCARGLCEWRDVCVWGPYVKVLPPNARIIRIR
jgi:hypothetical protein